MKYAIVSDIHANLQAWNAVWLDIRSMSVDMTICLGDLVGYGPNPCEVLESLYTNVDYFVLGNHDAALCGKMDVSCFNDRAAEMINWTSERLGKPALQFLTKLPLTLIGSGFRCAHGDFGSPAFFNYVIEAEDAIPGWDSVDEQLLFIGHTHRPNICVIGRSNTPYMIHPEDFVLEKEKRFLVNVGSVGHPRDADPRASYCVYDSESGSVFWRKIPFDLDAYRQALETANVPVTTSPFLDADPRKACAPLRELVPFSPPATPEKAVRDTIEVQEISILRRRIRKWKTMFLAVLIILLIGLSVSGVLWLRAIFQRSVISGIGKTEIQAEQYAPQVNLLSFPGGPVKAGKVIRGWSIHMDDRFSQQVSWGKVDGESLGFIMRSTNPRKELRISSPAMQVVPGMKMTLQVSAMKSRDFSGTLEAVIPLGKEPADVDKNKSGAVRMEMIPNFVVKEPNVPRRDGWMYGQQTFNLPARSRTVHFQVRGKFKGTVFLKNLRLVTKSK